MIPRSGRAWRRVSPRASSPTSTATAGRSARRPPRADRLGLAAAAAGLLLLGTACAYLNTFYNARKAYGEGVRLRAAAGDTLTPRARQEFESAIEKSAVVLDRHGESKYADDALLLMGRSFQELGRCSDASATYRRLLERFPDSELAPPARLGLARCERLLGDYAAASVELAALLETDAAGFDAAELLYERGLIELGRGDHAAAMASLNELLREHPAFAREHEVALRFAEAELAAGQHGPAIDAFSAYRAEALIPAARRDAALRLARAQALAGRAEESQRTYGELLEQGISDSLAAVVHAERGAIHAGAGRWDDAEADFRRAADLAPGTPEAARATLGRARIVWHREGRRAEALDILLDAFLHSPLSAAGDSARTEARRLERILHYERILDGSQVVAGLDDRDLVRSTALYRLGEEVLEVEKDAAEAAEIFDRLAREHPDSPWAPGALLASGLLAIRAGEPAEGEARLQRLVQRHPDHPAADSARRALGLPVPERPAAFYADPPVLASLAAALPRPEDPMVRIVDQLDRYVRGAAAGAGTGAAVAAGGQRPVGETSTTGPPAVPTGRPEP